MLSISPSAFGEFATPTSTLTAFGDKFDARHRAYELERNRMSRERCDDVALNKIVSELDELVSEAAKLIATNTDELLLKARMALWMSQSGDLTDESMMGDAAERIVWSIARDLLSALR